VAHAYLYCAAGMDEIAIACASGSKALTMPRNLHALLGRG